MNKPAAGFSTMSSAMRDAVNYHAWLLDMTAPELGKRILEIGPGFGQYTKIFARAADYLVAADIASECVEFLEAHYSNVLALVADLGEAQWLEKVTVGGLFDTVILFNVLEHIERDLAALGKICAALDTGGKLIMIVPAHPALFGDMDRLAGHFHRYDKQGLAHLMREAGFKTAALRYFNPIGGLGWWVNARFSKTKDLSSSSINGQILFFDKFLLPLSRFLTPLTASFFGQSLLCIAVKE